MNVIVDYMLKSNDERVVVNDYIENDPLLENNLDNTLNLANEFRLSSPQKSIWLYTGYEWQHIFDQQWHYHPKTQEKLSIGRWKRQQIVSQCDVLVDGRYIKDQKDITLKWRGSKNQKVINIQKTLQQGEIILLCN